MKLPHGPENKHKRIQQRAYAIYQGLEHGTKPDDTDINSEEAEEIEAAKKLAERWAKEGKVD